MDRQQWHRVLAFVAVVLSTSSLFAKIDKATIAGSGVTGGLLVHLGCGDGRVTATLLAADSFLVNGIDTDVASVAKARRHIQSLGLYGKISVDAFDGEHLPYADNVVNLIVGERRGKVSAEEIQRVLAPLGVAVIGGTTTTKPWPSRIDEWTHFLHGPDNNAVCDDSVVGPPRHMQWLADPLWIRHHGMLASVQAPVSAAGRLFYIVDKVWMGATTNAPDWRLVARDAFNGKLLWEKGIPTWTDFTRGFRCGPTQVQRVLVADPQNVHAVLSLNGPVSVLDARTGRLIRVLAGTENTEEFVVHDGVVFAVVAAEKTEQAYGAKYSRRGVPAEVANAKCLKAVDTKTGAMLWQWPKGSTTNIIPMTLAASGDAVYLQDGDSVVRLDRRTGKKRWATATKPVDLSKSRPGPYGVGRRLGWSVATLVVSDGVVLSTNGQELTAMACDSGNVLWRTQAKPTFLASAVDVLVNNQQAWLGPWFTQSLALRTGKVVRDNDLVAALLTATHHHRCYRNKGTSRFVIMSKRGAEFIDMTGDAHSRNNWVRGVCQYGMLPCNGLLYAPPHQCGCYKEAMLFGFWALAPKRHIDVFPAKERLSRGPAHGLAVKGTDAEAPGSSWPMYRRDELRSGATPHEVGTPLTEAWRAQAGRDLTAPVVADGLIVTASMATHQIHAFSVDTGKSLWSFTTGSRVDSPPTIHAGLVLFGSSDGKVYCLRASDGALVWCFHAALGRERTLVQERLESLWPVSGSVLVKEGVCYFVSGRSSYLDGGLRLYGLDPFTGAVKYESVLQSKHAGAMARPDSARKLKGDYKTLHAPDKSDAFFMEGNIADILVTDGSAIYLRHMKFSTSLVRQEGFGAHLQSTSTLLDRTEAERSHWMIGGGDFRQLPKASYQWMTKPRHKNFGQFTVPFGKILVFDDKAAWGTKHLEKGGGLRDALNLFCQKMPPPRLGNPGKDWEFRMIPKPIWETDLDMHPLALLKAGARLYVGGVALADYSGKKGDLADKAGILDVYAAATGRKLARYPLASPPVFDGLAAAGGRLFVSSHNGSVVCLDGLGQSRSASAPERPTGLPKDVAERGATEADYQWWRDARFGIFIHWGPGAFVHKNSLSWHKPPADRPSWGELGYMADVKDPDDVPEEIFNGGYKKYQRPGGTPPRIYNNLYRIFNPVKFDADEVAQMAVDAGAGYIIFVTKHHDGFCMWDSAYTDYDMMSTPSKRDVCKELSDACHKRGIRLLWYYSKADMHDARYDIKNPKPYDDYFYNQVEELMTKYGPIEGIWWDGGKIKTDNVRLFKMMNRIHPGCLTNGRVGKVPFGISFGSPEQRLGSFRMDRPWETCAVIHSSSWIWNGGKDIKSLRACLQMLIGCAVGDGNLALNYGPAPDGSIHPEVKANYLGMGRFLKQYGQSIYKTRGGPYKPGRWGGSTRRGSTAYLHVTQRWPIGVLRLPALPAKVVSCKSLTGRAPTFEQTNAGLEIRLDPKDHDRVDTIFALTLDKDAMKIKPVETLRGKTLTTDARVTASSSVNPRSKRGAPETVVYYSFETGEFAKHFGEESAGGGVQIDKPKKRHYSKEEIEQLRRLIGTNHRGHFWRFWMPKEGDEQPWIEVDLGNPETFSEVGITELFGKVRAYELQYRDGSGWRTFYRDAGTIDNLVVHLAKPVTARRVRLLITETSGQLPTIVAFDLFE